MGHFFQTDVWACVPLGCSLLDSASTDPGLLAWEPVSRLFNATSRLLLLSIRACRAASLLKPISMMSLSARSSTYTDDTVREWTKNRRETRFPPNVGVALGSVWINASSTFKTALTHCQAKHCPVPWQFILEIRRSEDKWIWFVNMTRRLISISAILQSMLRAVYEPWSETLTKTK